MRLLLRHTAQTTSALSRVVMIRSEYVDNVRTSTNMLFHLGQIKLPNKEKVKVLIVDA